MTTNYTEQGGDLDEVYASKDFIMDAYPDLLPAMTLPGLWTWGQGSSGQLGQGALTDRSSPVTTAGGGYTWKTVSISTTGAAIKNDGTLWTWGNNGSGQIGDGTTTQRTSPVTTAGGGTNWKQARSALDGNMMVAVKTDGTLWTWGIGNWGALGEGSAPGGAAPSGVRSSPGTTLGGGTNWKQGASSGYHCSAVKTDGTLWSWGYNASGQLGDGTVTSSRSPITTVGAITNWVSVDTGGIAGPGFTAGITSDGRLWTWGDGTSGKLGTGSTANRSSPGTTAGGGTTWKKAACGDDFMGAIKTDGTLWTWGVNTNGQLGNGNATNRSSPGTTAGGGTNWKDIAIGRNLGIGLKTDGTLWAWGYNAYGNAGDGTTANVRSSPISIAGGGTNWKVVPDGMGESSAAISELGNW